MMRLLIVLVFTMLVAGCAAQPHVRSQQLEIRPASYEKSPGSVAYVDPHESRMIYVSEIPIFTQNDIKIARQTIESHTGRPAIHLTLRAPASGRMDEHTRNHIGEPVAIFLNGELLSSPTVQSRISTDLLITGGPDGLDPDQTRKILDSVHTD